MGSAPLADVQVVDLTTGIAGPYCTKLFADAGAEVVKVEPAGGDLLCSPAQTEYLAGAAAGRALAAALRSRRTIAGTNYMDLIDALQGRPPIVHPLRFLDTPGVEQTADGMVGVNANTGRMFEMFLIMIERPDLLDVPEVARIVHRVAMGAEWQETVDAWMRRHTTAEVVAAAAEHRVPAAPVHDGRSVVDDEQYAARGL